MNAHRIGTAGFTLIEMLVSLAIMSLIGTLLLASVQLAGQSWRMTTRDTATAEEIRRARDFLRQSLSAIVPPRSANGADIFMTGTATSLDFVSNGTHALGDTPTRYRVGLSGNGSLAVSYRSYRDTAGSREWVSETLLQGVDTLAISYLARSGEPTDAWLTHWDRASPLPRLIRIDVRFTASGREWPTLYVRPLNDANTGCVFDVVSLRCRGTT